MFAQMYAKHVKNDIDFCSSRSHPEYCVFMRVKTKLKEEREKKSTV